MVRSLPTIRWPRIQLDERLIAPGQWIDGRIVLSRSLIRAIAEETGQPIRRVLFETAYHEAFHGFVEPIARLISRLRGIEDVYDASYTAMVFGSGRGSWYRTEEWLAESTGRWRSLLRTRYGWR